MNGFTGSTLVGLLAGSVYADFSTMRENFMWMMGNQTYVADRTFDSIWAAEMIDSINSYGCWCYFQENHGRGKGSPQNEVDAQCKILHDGYTCIIMDAEAEGKTCTPWDQSYNSGTGLGLVVSDPENNTHEAAIHKSCSRVNRKNNCAARACMVENYFVMQIFKQFLASVVFDPSLKHALGNFSPAADCPTRPGPYSEKECCGKYPIRFPYKTQNGDKDCCGQKTYNTGIMQCCAGNSVKLNC